MRLPLHQRHRFIPTRAGNTSSIILDYFQKTVHPHASGEHILQCDCFGLHGGSSPRERGTQNTALPTELQRRFIPTRAGNTVKRCIMNIWITVHPHASGEHSTRLGSYFADCGSSPRERGTHQVRIRSHHRHRFIPTRAGNTTSAHHCIALTPVHPHASGEHADLVIMGHCNIGSSPRERGTLRRVLRSNHHARFIPTRAGNTYSATCNCYAAAVHPHASGEHQLFEYAHRLVRGSSPRERGTQSEHQVRCGQVRFIPTRAGNTDLEGGGFGLHAVHPHASGEHTSSNQLIFQRKLQDENSTG